MVTIMCHRYLDSGEQRFMDAEKEDMQVVRVEDTKNRLKWKTMIRCGNR